MRQKAEGYGMPSARVDGMDVLKVRQASEEALTRVPEGGPFFLEAITYRFRGHSRGDPERYRRSEEVKKWQEDDPIGVLRKQLLATKAAKEPGLDALEAEVDEEIREAVRFAEESPEPGPEELFAHVYADDGGTPRQ
jgi:pyruvate dehydrogenase E1 component alpha subunit